MSYSEIVQKEKKEKKRKNQLKQYNSIKPKDTY